MPVTTGGGRSAVFAPLDGGAGRSDAVVRRLGSAIALGLIADGEQLPAEAELATSLGVATVTLREALSDLRRRGLVETRRGRGGGSFVRASEPALEALSRLRLRELATTDLRELGDFHAAVAGTAARLAAERASDAEIDRLAGILDALAAACRRGDQRRLEGRYYIEVAAAAQSVRLTHTELELQSELSELQVHPRDAEGARRAVEQHRQVVAAIRSRDGALARELTEARIAARTFDMIEIHVTETAVSAPLTSRPACPAAGAR